MQRVRFIIGLTLLILFGALLRIDVSGDAGYTIPLDNPFAEQTRARPEIWAYGLRNPWRFSFDRLSGALWLADVGQNAWEEINTITRGGNFGWNRMEGRQCYPSDETRCNQEGLIVPIVQYSHAEGCSITGGYVYRGSRVPNLIGAYLYGDFCSGRIWGLRYDEFRGVTEHVQLADTALALSSFGEDEAGEVYVLDYDGGIYRFSGS